MGNEEDFKQQITNSKIKQINTLLEDLQKTDIKYEGVIMWIVTKDRIKKSAKLDLNYSQTIALGTALLEEGLKILSSEGNPITNMKNNKTDVSDELTDLINQIKNKPKEGK